MKIGYSDTNKNLTLTSETVAEAARLGMLATKLPGQTQHNIHITDREVCVTVDVVALVKMATL